MQSLANQGALRSDRGFVIGQKQVMKMTKAERIAQLEAKVAKLKAAYESAEWELEKVKGGGLLMDRLFKMIEAMYRYKYVE